MKVAIFVWAVLWVFRPQAVLWGNGGGGVWLYNLHMWIVFGGIKPPNQDYSTGTPNWYYINQSRLTEQWLKKHIVATFWNKASLCPSHSFSYFISVISTFSFTFQIVRGEMGFTYLNHFLFCCGKFWTFRAMFWNLSCHLIDMLLFLTTVIIYSEGSSSTTDCQVGTAFE